MKLDDLIDICKEKKCISLVGGGGKTTLMYVLAGILSEAGKRVLVSTTTHIRIPDSNYAENADDVDKLWNEHTYAVIGTIDGEKLTFPSKELWDAIDADIILLEADGAKCHPFKVPADHEPVIFKDSDLVIGVMGMTAMGKSLSECCFRFDTNGQWLGDDKLIDENIAATVLASKKGTKKNVEDRDYIVVLNQCDNNELEEKASKIKAILDGEYGIQALCCCLRDITNA